MISPIEKNSYSRSIIIAAAIVLGCASSILMAGQERIIHFPKDCSIGGIYVVGEYPTDDFWSWMFSWETQFLAEAKGDVKVPAGKILRLDVSEQAWSKPEPFSGTRPDDIQSLNFFTYKHADASVLKDVKHMTGLEALNLAHTETIESGLENLVALKKLRYLYLPGHIRTKELAHLRMLPSLDFLYIGGPMVTNDKMVHIGKVTSLTHLSLTGSDIGTGLIHLKGLKSLQYLNLGENCNYEIDRGLSHIAGLTEVRVLILQSTALSDAGLAHVEGFTKLEELDLRNTRIGDEGLKHLRGLKMLKKLNLRKNPATNEITDAGIAYLKDLNSLEELTLPYTGLTDAALSELVGLNSLKKLEAYGEGITDKGLAELAKMKPLEKLALRSDNITDNGMITLSSFSGLKSLELNDCNITDAGLMNLARLKRLERLNITEIQLTGDGLAFLKELPSLTELNLLFVSFGVKGVTHLKCLTALEKLWIAYPDINIGDRELEIFSSLKSLRELDVRLRPESITETFTDQGFSHLSKLTALKRLQLSGNKMLTDNGLKSLSNLKALENIHMYQCNKITNAGLKYLEVLTLLKWLYLKDSQITREGLLNLKKKIPGLDYSF
jgi:Leucine-rich repeat (LRR) protein